MKYLLISLLFLLILFLILPVQFKIKFIYDNNGPISLNISTYYFFGLFKPEIYPFDKDKKNSQSRRFNDLKISIKDLQYRSLVTYIWDKLVFKEITWDTKIGFIDAALVGLFYGIVWSFKSFVLDLILKNREIDSIDINVIPIFNENQLDISLNCIIKIRMVYIITVWIWFFKLYKGGEQVVRASNRRINENYNE